MEAERAQSGEDVEETARSESVNDEIVAEREGDDLTTAGTDQAPLLQQGDLVDFRKRWEQLQIRFVDDPRGSVQEADALVLDLTQRLTSSFSDERTTLEQRWDGGDDVSTEDLRTILQRYRSFFDRLLSA
jgi:hypothetical protein